METFTLLETILRLSMSRNCGHVMSLRCFTVLSKEPRRRASRRRGAEGERQDQPSAAGGGIRDGVVFAPLSISVDGASA